MKVYLVYGNDYCSDSYGQMISTFGIFTTMEAAEKVRKKVLDDWNHVEDVWVEIREMTVDVQCDHFLGGYVE